MIPVDEALDAVRATVRPTEVERLAIQDARGRVLAEGVTARDPDPPFDGSAMDGYALRAADVAGATGDDPAVLDLVGRSEAGHPFDGRVETGQAVRILTGATLPAGADTVVMQEKTRTEPSGESPERVRVLEAPREGRHVRRAGHDFAAGDEILEAGTRLGAAAIGLLAKAGIERVACHRRPRVRVLTTGDELRPPGAELGPGEIHEANIFTIRAAALETGAEAEGLGVAPDEPGAIATRVRQGLDADVLVTTGGVSVGDRDHLRDVFAQVGVEKVFWKVRIKPGKPIYFGRWEDPEDEGGRPTLVFGLPGNPASALVTFRVFCGPALRAMEGERGGEPPVVRAELTERVTHRPGRLEYRRAVCRVGRDGLVCRPVGGRDSSALRGFATANALIVLPVEAEVREAGETVEVLLLDRPRPRPPEGSS